MLEADRLDLLAEGGETFRRAYRSLSFNDRQKLFYRAAAVPVRDQRDLALRLGYVRRELGRAVVTTSLLALLAVSVWFGFNSARDTGVDVVFALLSASGPAAATAIRMVRLRRVRDRLEHLWMQSHRVAV